MARTHTNKDSSVPLPFEEEPCVYVNSVLKGEDGSRKYDKKHSLFYCGQVVQKMSRQLWRKHSDKVDVAKAFSLPKNSSERRRQLDYIRNKDITLMFWRRTEASLSHVSNQRKKVKEENLLIVCTAMDYSQNECGDIFKSANSSSGVTPENGVNQEFKHCVHLLNLFHMDIAMHTGSS